MTFEKLADSLLRSANPDYNAVMHFGINARGKTVKSPVDGFCKVPNSAPEHFIYVQHTTTDIKSLQEKWLNEITERKSTAAHRKRDKGDLIKAGELAADLTKKFPDASFTVVLTSNRPVDVDLAQSVFVKAKQLALSVDIWEQTRITRFLDNQPEGNWLRWKHLGIAAEQLSEPLFGEVCKKSFENYLKNLPSEENSWVTREIEEQLSLVLADSKCSLSLLASESGQGKSVLCAREFARRLKMGGSCLWAGADLVQNSSSIDELITRIVLSHEPSLWPGANQTILEIVTKKDFLLIVDDVNRAADPSSLVRKLSTWLSPRSSSNKVSGTSNVQVLCPVWPAIIGQFASEAKSSSWVRIISFGLMSESEADNAIEIGTLTARHPLSLIERKAIAQELGRDPYLIGLWCNLVNAQPNSPASDLARDVQERFLSDGLAQAAAVSPNFTAADFRESLMALSTAMLVNRNTSPCRSDAWQWLDTRGEMRAALSALLNHGRIIRLDHNESILFRHDRLRDLLLQLALPRAIKDDPSLVSEPFFARYLGPSVADGQLSADYIEELRIKNPLALFEAIAHFKNPATPTHETILERATNWIEQEVVTNRAMPNLIWQVSGSLYRTDSAQVLKLTEKMPRNNYVLAARLRNGCARSGAIKCGQYKGMFQPSVRDSLFENTFSHALRLHRQSLIQGVTECLNDRKQPEWQLRGTLLVAGFLADPVLLPIIVDAWRNSAEQTNALSFAIWACLRCASDDRFELFDELLKYWNTLSTIEGTHGRSESSNVWSWLHHSFRWIQSNGIKWHLRAADGETQAAKFLARLVDEIDDPEAVTFIVRNDAKIIRNTPKGEDNLSLWHLTRFLHWNPKDSLGGRSLGAASQNKLIEIWVNPAEDLVCRKVAFRLWSLGATREHLSLFGQIAQKDPLFDSTLWTRAELGDFSIVAAIADKIRNSPHWCWVAGSIWCSEIETAVESVLQSQIEKVKDGYSDYGPNDISVVCDLLIGLPKPKVEQLLIKYWEHFGRTGDFVICALRIGTTRSRELAAQSIDKCPKEIDLLRHLTLRMRRKMGDGDDFSNQYTFLKSLEPHLDRLFPEEIRSLVWEVEFGKNYEWYQQFLKDRLSPGDQARLFPNDDDLARELDNFEKNPHQVPHYWLEDLERRRVAIKRLWPILEKWFMASPTPKRQEIAFEIIENIGTRTELPLLNRISKTLNMPPDNLAVANVEFSVCLRTLA